MPFSTQITVLDPESLLLPLTQKLTLFNMTLKLFSRINDTSLVIRAVECEESWLCYFHFPRVTAFKGATIVKTNPYCCASPAVFPFAGPMADDRVHDNVGADWAAVLLFDFGGAVLEVLSLGQFCLGLHSKYTIYCYMMDQL